MHVSVIRSCYQSLAVAAIAEMSLVDIVSRPRGQEHVYSTIFKVVTLFRASLNMSLLHSFPNSNDIWWQIS